MSTIPQAARSEETFCRFPDGSPPSTGTLEQYDIRMLQ